MDPSAAAEVRKSTGLHYTNPRLPLNIRLPNNLSIGSKIHIHGAVLTSPTRFSINFKDAEVGANTLFHFNPRFGDEVIVVRNSRYNEAWGTEERDGDSPFVPGNSFLLTITAEEAGYEVAVNGDIFTVFQYRDEMPASNVSHLTIKGDIVVNEVTVPGSSMPLPLMVDIPAKMHVGDQIVISGDTQGDADRFAVNLQCGSDDNADIMLHFNPRFGTGEIVCNSRCAGQWDEEIREGLMLGAGQPLVLTLGASSEAFHTFIHNQKAVQFNHRLNMSNACVLEVTGDIAVKDVRINSAPCRLPPIMTEEIRELDDSPSSVSFCECLPAKLELPSPLQPGQMIVLNCYICPDPTRFNVNLQWGEDGENIALHYNPRWDDDSGLVSILNTKAGGEWGSEERAGNDIEAGTYVAIIIYCKDDGYSIAVDGEVVVPSFPHRMDSGSVTHVVVDGCVLLQRIFAA